MKINDKYDYRGYKIIQHYYEFDIIDGRNKVVASATTDKEAENV